MPEENQEQEQPKQMVILEASPVAKTCRVLAKSGQPCGQPIISDTIPYCYMHMREADASGQSRRYFEVAPDELKRELRQHADDAGFKDLTGEIAVARAILSILVKKMETHKETDGSLKIDKGDAELIEKYIYLIKGTVESDAKVRPPQVITLHDMRKLIGDIINIIKAHLGPENRTARERIVTEIQKYCMADLLNRAMEVPFGGTPKQRGGDVGSIQ
jgi:hypothetical protein